MFTQEDIQFSKNYNKLHENLHVTYKIMKNTQEAYKRLTKYMKKNTFNHTSTWGTYKFSKNDSKTHKKNTIFHTFT